MTNILVVGSGAREHALVWKLAQSRHQPQIFVAPGNPGMDASPAGTRQAGATCAPIAVDDIDALVAFARERHIDLVVVGPEGPLTLGLADRLRAIGIRVFGPGAVAARLEGSKAFAKEIMARAGIPTAQYASFTDAAAARAYIERHGAPIVVKADGLAAGKGVTVAQTISQALAAAHDAMERKVFGAAGSALVIEECLKGDELSVMALVAGDTYRLLPVAQDHKQAFDGDTGPNTGGMGALCPVHWADASLLTMVGEQVFEPLLAELAHLEIEYRGVLYAGLMITSDGPKVIEFNVRFGDPETQVITPLLDTDLVETLMAVAEGTLVGVELATRPGSAVGVTLASEGYPGASVSDRPITLDLADLPPETLVFHGGTRKVDGRLVTAGGRVFTVVGVGENLDAARASAYAGVRRVSFEGMRYRSDIGRRAHGETNGA